MTTNRFLTPRQFADHCRAALSGSLQSVVLYGSSVTGDYDPAWSDRNLLVIARRLRVGDLIALASAFQLWTAAGEPPPLLFRADELASAADTFPLEVLDIQDAHEILWGEPLPKWNVKVPDLRLQLERELKEKLHHLRASYVLAAGQPHRIIGLLVDSATTMLVLARGTLRLFRPEVPRAKHQALDQLAAELDFSPGVFHEILKVKQNAVRPRDIPADEAFAAYLTAIETIEAAVNAVRLTALPISQET